MKRLIFLGDGLSLGKSGYGELLHSHLILSAPQSSFEFSSFSDDEMTYEKAFTSVPVHVIGKAPVLVLLALGYNDILGGKPIESLKKSLVDTVNLILDKTQASIVLTNLCSAFFQGNSRLLDRCREFNQICGEVSNTERITQIDVDTPTTRFLDVHRLGKGEKRSLHMDGPRLTTLGVLLLSRIISEKIQEVLN